ncbi:ferritin-like domain-containing protein [Acetobacteraceae bacterium KSS8]|uniref:Ferritin-like domain-containing protein n=1 Tax=Endosaccharibacter trunci TaxID=2812733 RepID=A0ABT1W7I4_9PROT|nr:ferritin-like domain-containing protein [Acetobacteraceae bacterium KSS8]
MSDQTIPSDRDERPHPPELARRRLFKQATVGAAALSAFALQNSVFAKAASAATTPAALTDPDILNFALNLEYLEAEFYLRGAYGYGLGAADISGTGTLGTVTGGSKVTFTSALYQQYAQEVAQDELSHVRFLRAALGTQAVARPSIDLKTSFTTAAIAAGVISPGQTFDPFANEANFLVAAFIFEDIGVTAYNGAATFITSKDYLQAAASILAVEAYHAGSVRTMLIGNGITDAPNKISALRAAASEAVGGSGAGDDQGVTVKGVSNVVPADSNALAFARTPSEVLNIVYLGGASAGYGFFPNKLNGTIN